MTEIERECREEIWRANLRYDHEAMMAWYTANAETHEARWKQYAEALQRGEDGRLD